MLFSDLNIIMILFFFFISTLLKIQNSTLHLLLTAELLWISLFALVLTTGFLYNDLNILSLTFFFLVLSAIEFGFGIILLLLQNTFTRSINLAEGDYNYVKFLNRFKTSLYLNRILWKL